MPENRLYSYLYGDDQATMNHQIRHTLWHPLAYLAAFVLLTLLGILTEKNYQGKGPSKFNSAAFEKVLHEKESLMVATLDHLKARVADKGVNDWLLRPALVNEMEGNCKKNGFAVFIYHNDSLAYWSDENIPVPNRYPVDLFSHPFVYLTNSWHVVKQSSFDGYKVVGLILIKHNYPYENRFLRNEFQADFNIPSWVAIADAREKTRNNFPVYDLNGDYLFSLSVRFYSFLSNTALHLPQLLYLLGLVVGLLGMRFLLKRIRKAGLFYLCVAGLTIVFVVIRILQMQYRMPVILYNHEIFSPGLFAWSKAFPSLGDLLIHAVLFFFIVYNIYFGKNVSAFLLGKGRTGPGILLGTGMVILSVAILFSYVVIRNLILNSSISFEIQRLLEVDQYSFFALLAIALILTSLILLLDCILAAALNVYNAWFTLLLLAASLPVGYLLFGLIGHPDIPTLIFWLALASFLIWIRVTPKKRKRYSVFLGITLMVSVYAVYAVIPNSDEKERNSRKVLAVTMAAEHDPVAELLMDEMKRRIQDDPVLAGKMQKEYFTEGEYNEIVQYLQSKYFSGFWEQYMLWVIICNPASSLEVTGSDTLVNCYSFFSRAIDEQGELVTDTNFYYLNDADGRITYLGEFYFPGPYGENKLFIQLDSRLVYEQMGYPELLLDEEFARPGLPDRYSYARYYRGQLIAQSGLFPYSLDLSIYRPEEGEFSFVTVEKYNHLIYRPDAYNTIILSQDKLKFIDIFVLLSYLFVFFFLLMNLMVLIIDFPGDPKRWQLNFKNKIQLSMIGILFLALLLLGGGAVYYSFDQYRHKHDENIREKIRSVYVELDHRFAFENDLTRYVDPEESMDLDELLVKLSNVFFSDINLYDTLGNLISSSRPEIFDQGLIGRKINGKAYRELTLNKKAEFIHREYIGKMHHLSAYAPYINSQQKILAYINLPYFTRQYLLTREISTLMVAIVNISFLLILLTISLAVVISNRITDPLRIIQERFSGIKLGKTTEYIVYEGQDEIGELVREYNRMVDELGKSMELLARSERESAWREMAKQIAHEINNPLTPMKLSIQQIKRSFEDKSKDWEGHFRKFSEVMIEQIDHLSSIASAFSNFARMPKTLFEPVDIIAKINNSIDLFKNTENIEFLVDLGGNENLMVLADKEQMIGVFTNLIKNAIQSIPDDRKGMIRIGVTADTRTVHISIEDNGKGIPEEMGDKLFVPNFTTKSSGMGLGLAMVKNIVENTGGTVWYETTPGKGSIFFVDLPLMETRKEM